MSKLIKYKSYRTLKSSGKPVADKDILSVIQVPELEEFLHLLQQKLRQTRKIKNVKA